MYHPKCMVGLNNLLYSLEERWTSSWESNILSATVPDPEARFLERTHGQVMV